MLVAPNCKNVVYVYLDWIVQYRQLKRIDGVGTKNIQFVCSVNCSTWECVCPSSVVTVTFRSVVPVVGMTSFDDEIRGRVSSFWSLGVPIFFHVDLDRRLQDAPVSTKNGNFRLLMVTGTDGDDVVVSSSL